MKKERIAKDADLKNFFISAIDILSKPQLTKKYVKGFFSGEFSLFDKLSVKDSTTAILYKKKENRYYKINLDTGERKEIPKPK